MPNGPFMMDDVINTAPPLIVVLDDDLSVRESLVGLFRSVGLRATAFASVDDVARGNAMDQASCLVLDIRMPGMDGLTFQQYLLSTDQNIPLIFMTGYGDVPMTVQAMKGGAIDFLPKPFDESAMLEAVAAALERDRRQRQTSRATAAIWLRFETLTPREREVMRHVTSGQMNKQIAATLDLSEITIKVHRGRIMQKMAARSLADLVRMAEVVAGRLAPVSDNDREPRYAP
jgi:FixJ family two-component response regulator